MEPKSFCDKRKNRTFFIRILSLSCVGSDVADVEGEGKVVSVYVIRNIDGGGAHVLQHRSFLISALFGGQ
jgi:hypothetical protein